MPNITIGGYEFDQEDFHRILKPKILKLVSEKDYNISLIGSNPDITVKKGLIILEGQSKKGGQIKTDINFAEALRELGYLN